MSCSVHWASKFCDYYMCDYYTLHVFLLSSCQRFLPPVWVLATLTTVTSLSSVICTREGCPCSLMSRLITPSPSVTIRVWCSPPTASTDTYHTCSHYGRMCSQSEGVCVVVTIATYELVGSYWCNLREEPKWIGLATKIQILPPLPSPRPNLSDVERLSTLVKMSASSLASNVASSGHSYAMTAAASGLFPSCQLGELFSGMTQVSGAKYTLYVVSVYWPRSYNYYDLCMCSSFLLRESIV